MLRTHSGQLTINHQTGNAELSKPFEAELGAGKTVLKLPHLDAGIDAGAISLLGADRYEVKMAAPREKAKLGPKARIEFSADQPQTVEGRLVIKLTGLQAETNHMVAVSADGNAQKMSSAVVLRNGGQTSIHNERLRLLVGDTENRRSEGRVFSAMKAAADVTSVSAASASAYQFDLAGRVSLDAGASAKVNLFGQDFALPGIAPELRFAGNGVHPWGVSEVEQEGPAVASRYLIDNTEANGLGKILPAGAVEIRGEEGQRLSTTSIRNTPIGKQIELGAGDVFDLSTKSKQVGITSADVGNRRNIGATQVVTLDNKASRPFTVQFQDAIHSSDEERPTTIANVKLNGQPLAEGQWSFDRSKGYLEVPNVEVPAGGQATVSYDVAMSYRTS